MAYLTFEQYQSMGGTMAEDDFAKAEPKAEIILDSWTFSRLKNQCFLADLQQMGEMDSVQAAMAVIVDSVSGIGKARAAKFGGTEVSSFNNGVNSFSFSGGSSSLFGATSAEASTYHQVVGILPVELVSICVDGGCCGS